MDADALIKSLTSRIGEKISALGSGGRVDALENDPLVSQTIRSLVHLSQYKVQVTAFSLLGLLESTLTNALDDAITSESLGIQAFVLKIIDSCLSRHWAFCLDPTLMPSSSRASIILEEAGSDLGHRDEDTLSIKSNKVTGESIFSLSRGANGPGQSATPVLVLDPPPLDDFLAASLMKIIFQFLHITYAGDIADGFLSLSVNSNGTSISKTDRSPLRGLGKPTSDTRAQIQHTASQILKYISASNWPIIFQRFRAKITHLTGANEEGVDLGDLRYLEWCNLNERRLSMVFQELNAAFLQFKRPAQLTMSLILRKTIWNWIETYPIGFIALHQSQKRIEGSPEILFDMCNSLADNARKKAVFWPLQIMLLVLCPDILASISRNLGGTSKKVQFFDGLRKSLKGTRLADVAAVAYVDLCKASTYLANIKDAALKNLIPDIELELKEKLFDPEHPFVNADGNIDKKLMTDCLTAFFRLNVGSAMQSLIPICLREDAPIAFRLVLVKSCYNIAAETYLPWNPTISSMYSTLAGPMRQLFNENFIQDRDANPKGPLPADKKARRQYQMRIDEANEKLDILMSVLRVYRRDPMLAIVGHSPETQYKENSRLLHNITICLHDPNLTIRTCAAEALLELHHPSLIEKWGPEAAMMESFWSCSSTILSDLSRQILEYKDKDDGIRYFAEILYHILIRRVKFLRAHRDNLHLGIQIPERISSLMAVEVALLYMLCMPDAEVCSQATSSFGLLCEEMELTEALCDPDMLRVTLYANLSTYKEMARAGVLVTGRVAQQKSIRKVFRLLRHQTHANLSAWEDVYKRWRSLKSVATRPPEEPALDSGEIPKKKTSFFASSRTSQSSAMPTPAPDAQDHKRDLELWQNYTGFLCAMGGVCVLPDEKMKEKQKEREDLIKRGVNFEFRTKAVKKMLDCNQVVNRFIMEMVELLICESALARETVKELAGTELNPGMYGNLFRHLESIVGRFFSAEGEVSCNDSYTMFVEQAISVLKLILDRLNDSAEYIFAVDLDMGNLLFSFSRYLNHTDCSATSLRVKVKMAQLTEVLMLKRDLVSLRHEFHVRNKLLESLVEWTSDFCKPAEMGMLGESGEKLYRDLDLAVMKTVVLLLEGLPILSQDAKTEAERQEIKSKLFYKYFSYFIKLLNRCRILETIEFGSHSTKENSDLMNLLSKSKEQCKDLGPLKDYTILALSNLLSANIETGLKYSLSMGYHEDTKTRSAFMQVLTNILKQGTEFTSLSQTTDKDRFQKVLDILSEPDLHMLMTLCDVCPVHHVDDLGTVLLSVLDSLGITIPVLKALIEKEIHKTDSSPELFRRNSMASRLLALFAKSYGAEYQRYVLQPILIDMMENPRPYEVDPSKIGKGASAEANLQNLKQMSQAFLDSIINSGSRIPPAVREICSYLSQVVVVKFPEAKLTSVGGLMFLRFFCPTIVAPDINGLVKLITDKDLRRGLLLITKVIQNLANNVFFGAKEAFMISLNDVLTEYIPKVSNYLAEISTPLPNSSYEPPAPPKLDEEDVMRLHYYLVENIDRMGREVTTRKLQVAYPITIPDPSPAENENLRAAAKMHYYKLSILLAQLGAPENRGKKKEGPVGKVGEQGQGQAYKEFMARNGRLNTASIQEKKIFYEGGPSKVGRPVYYFIARRLVTDTVDMQMVMAHIFQLLAKLDGRPYEILVDLTQFAPPNEVLLPFVAQFTNTFPPNAVAALAALYLYNINTGFQRYAKQLGLALPPALAAVTYFPCNLTELSEYIEQADISLPKLTLALESESGVSFSPVTCINQFRQQIPSSIKILQETMHICMLKKQEVMGLTSYFNDVYHISQIDEVSISSYKDENCLLVKVDQAPALTFISPKIDLICKAIRNAKARYIMSKPNGIAERVIRPSNLPGTLLNMALLNSGSEDPNLRLASYNMLFALSTTFNFDVGNQLLIAKDLCIPGNNTSFVLTISERLAVTEPQLTFEFLSECFVGIKSSTTPLKHLCLEYMAPWLTNLIYLSRHSTLEAGGIHSRTRELLVMMFDLTVKETEMAPSIQSKIWRTIGKVDELIDMVLDTIVQYAVEHGVGSLQAEVLADTTVTLAAVNVRAGKLVSRLRKLIAKTAINPKRVLTEHTAWVEIAVLVRFNLMLSFNNRAIAEHYLPEIFHTVSVLAASGPPIIRSSIHGLVINVVQSLCTCIPRDHPHLATLSTLLADFSEPKFKLLFGLNRNNANAFSHNVEATTDTLDAMPLSSLESIIHTLLDVMTYGSASVDRSNIWRARWMGLVTSTAFQFNPAVQPRAFIVLGCLARGEVDDDLLYQILVALRGALELFDDSDCNLIVSIVLCLSNIIENLPEDSRFLQPMFWLGIAIVQIGHMPLVASAVNLLEVVIRRMNEYAMFRLHPPGPVLLAAREPFRLVACKLDQGSGVSFTTNFSFAFAGVMLRGLKQSGTKAATLAVFKSMLSFSSSCPASDRSDSQVLGYLAPQLPLAAKNGDLRELLGSVGIAVAVDPSEPNVAYHKIFGRLSIPDQTTAALLVAMAAGLLQHTEFEAEYLFLYGFLAGAGQSCPEVFTLLQARLVPKMNQVLNSNQTAAIIEAVQSILYTVISNPYYKEHQDKDILSVLEPLGFQGLLDCAAIPKLSKEELLHNARLVAGLVENIIATPPAALGLWVRAWGRVWARENLYAWWGGMLGVPTPIAAIVGASFHRLEVGDRLTLSSTVGAPIIV
ncbi:Ras GTPase activating protein ira2 [Massospora cicadina]|nr:Ras GTPase activating protein ira2 [Massospora cicadina]